MPAPPSMEVSEMRTAQDLRDKAARALNIARTYSNEAARLQSEAAKLTMAARRLKKEAKKMEAK